MSAMVNPSKPDPLGSILDRLNGTVLKVTKLRQSLDDLETELSEIRQLCENEIRACTAASITFKAATIPDPQRQLVPTAGIPASTSPLPSRGVSSSSQVFGNSTPLTGGVKKLLGLLPIFRSLGTGTTQVQAQIEASAPIQRQADKSPIQQEQIFFQRPLRPPIDPFLFPENMGLSSYAPALKREGNDWFVLFNASPKVKRVLDMNLVHNLVFEHSVNCIRFSRDGKRLAVGCQSTSHIYDVKTGVEVCTLAHGRRYIWSVCFSPEGKYLATAEELQITIWDITEKKIHRIFKGHQKLINTVHFLQNGQFIISGSQDGSARVWDIDARTFRVLAINNHYQPYDSEEHGVWSLSISPDGKYVAVSGSDTVVSILEITTGALVQRLRGHEYEVCAVTFTPDGKGLISGSRDHIVKYWDVSGLDIGPGANTALTSASSTCLMNLASHTYPVRSVALSHDAAWIVSGSEDGQVLFWDARTGVAQCMLSGHKDTVWQVDLSPTGNFLATASRDKRLRIWSYSVCS